MRSDRPDEKRRRRYSKRKPKNRQANNSMEQSRHKELDQLTGKLTQCVERFVEERLSSDYKLRTWSGRNRSITGRLQGPSGMTVDCSVEISYFGGNIYHLRAEVGEDAQRTFSVCIPEPAQAREELQRRVEGLCNYLLRELYCETGKQLLQGRLTPS